MTRTRSLIVLLVLAIPPAAFRAATSTAAPQPARQPVVLVTVDTLRADRLSPYGYPGARTPSLASFSSDSVLFENAYVQTPITLPSHASILTGTYPMFHKVQDVVGKLGGGMPTLATLLKQSGYTTGAFVGATVLSSIWGLNRGFDVYDDRFEIREGMRQVDLDRVERKADDVLTPALAWLGRNGNRPFFLWLHFYDPHDPYAAPAPYGDEFRARPYDGEVAYVDAVFGKLIQELKTRNVYEKSLVVFTSDHGESLGEHEEVHHGYFLYEASLRVPLMFKLPDGRSQGTRLANRVRSVDIAPTILQALNIQPPASFQGESLMGMMAGKRGSVDLPVYAETYYPKVHFNWSPLFAFLSGPHKYVEAPERELYELAADRSETNNLAASNSAVAGRLRTELLAVQRRYGAPETAVKEPAARQPDPEMAARLKSLGYIAVSAGAPSKTSGDLPDPKRKIRVYNLLNRGINFSRSGMPDRAIQVFTRVAAAEPNMPIVHFLLGMEYFEKKWFLKAAEEFKETLEHNPDSTVAMFNLARSYLESGQTEQAEAGFRYLIEREPGHFSAHHQLSIAYARRADYARAAEEQRKALGIRPDYAEGHNNLGSYYLNLDRVDDAIRAYQKAVSLSPGFLMARINLVLAYIRNRAFDSAIREAGEVLARDPRRGLAHFYLGQAYHAKGMKDEARDAFKKAKELDPKLDVPAIL
jgi:arylsulfatase A-like enzyme/Tfp pilus assembly protein PilF